MKKIPSEVLEKAKFLLDSGGFVKYLGRSKDGDIFYGAIEGCDTGFPSVFIFNGRFVREVNGFEALAVSRPFLKD